MPFSIPTAARRPRISFRCRGCSPYPGLIERTFSSVNRSPACISFTTKRERRNARHRKAILSVVEIKNSFFQLIIPHHHRRYPHHSYSFRNIMSDHCSCSNYTIFSNMYTLNNGSTDPGFGCMWLFFLGIGSSKNIR